MSVRPLSQPLNSLSFIDRLIAEIELSPTQFTQAQQSYEGVTSVLQKEGSPIRVFNPYNCSQGSMRIGTTVRPPAQEEHDLDVLCWLNVSGAIYTPHEIYELVWETLGTDGTYRGMRERWRRCIRINYARQFHLDITPAIPDWVKKSGSLYIPDREQKIWCSTHPIGFADEWFTPISKRLPTIIEHALLGNVRSFNASVEPLPDHGAFDKTPLQRTVQLVKYDRDRHYAEDAKHRPSSILLTTLTALAYANELPRAASSLLEFIIRVMERIPDGIVIHTTKEGYPIYEVANPVNHDENFAEKWTSEHYRRFMEWHTKVMNWIRSTSSLEGRGADVLLGRMSERFGTDRVARTAKALGQQVRELHEQKQSRVSPAGYVGSVGVAATPTVFFGE